MTIEERATDIFENYPHPYEMPYDDNAYFDGDQVIDMMVKIATEQKKIDIDKACEAHCNLCKWICIDGGCLIYNNMQECESVELIRKAMEE